MKRIPSCTLLALFAAGLIVPAAAQQPRQKRVHRPLADGRRVVADELKVTFKESAARRLSLNRQGKAKAVAAVSVRALHADILDVRARHTASRAWLKGDALPHRVRRSDGKISRIARNCSIVLRPGADVIAVRAALELHPDIERVDLRELLPLDAVPNDPQYSQQWAPPITRLENAWDIPGRGHVNVAVIDTGLQMAHPEFAGRVVFHDGYADFDDGEAPASGTGFDHGTHVAGIIAATRNNNQGVAGYSNDIDLMILNCAEWDSDDSSWKIGDADDAIDDAVANGASVINCSFTFSDGLEDEVVDAYNAGVLVVHSAGNALPGQAPLSIAGTWQSESIAPFTITATMSSGTPASDVYDGSYSYFGPGVDLAAPGTGIWSTVHNGYGGKSGTSMAAPQVSGAAALMMSMNPTGLLGHRAVRHLLIRMARDKGTTGYDDFYGYGALRLERRVYQACRDATTFVKGVNNPTSIPEETGACDYPWRSIDAALSNVPDGAVIMLNGGVTDPPDLALTEEYYAAPSQPITKPCTISAIPDRRAVIGGP
jgi:thermitase